MDHTMTEDENSMESVDIETRSTPSPADRQYGAHSPGAAAADSPASSPATPPPSSPPHNTSKLSFGISRILSDDVGEKRDYDRDSYTYSARIFGPYPMVLARPASPGQDSPGVIRVPVHRPVPYSPHSMNPHSPSFSPLMFPWMQDRKDRLTGEPKI